VLEIKVGPKTWTTQIPITRVNRRIADSLIIRYIFFDYHIRSYIYSMLYSRLFHPVAVCSESGLILNQRHSSCPFNLLHLNFDVCISRYATQGRMEVNHPLADWIPLVLKAVLTGPTRADPRQIFTLSTQPRQILETQPARS
jgi:hypothetical protein